MTKPKPKASDNATSRPLPVFTDEAARQAWLAAKSPEQEAEAIALENRAAQYRATQHRIVVSTQAMAPSIEATFASLSDLCEAWFTHMQGFDQRNFHGDCMLIVTELAKAVEADRKDERSDKIPYHGRDEEIADALVRIFHLCGKYGINIGPAFIAKMLVNLQRPFRHGKKY